MYERSRYLLDCHIAGFMYYDGLEVINDLKLGTTVSLKAEIDNPHDSSAVVIYYQSKKLGYIPSSKNSIISTMLYFGYEDHLEAQINYVSIDEHPERQFRIVVKIEYIREEANDHI